MSDFPRVTLENIRRTLMVFDHLTDPELKLIAANQLVLDAVTFSAKVGYWADGLRREIDAKGEGHGQSDSQ